MGFMVATSPNRPHKNTVGLARMPRKPLLYAGMISNNASTDLLWILHVNLGSLWNSLLGAELALHLAHLNMVSQEIRP